MSVRCAQFEPERAQRGKTPGAKGAGNSLTIEEEDEFSEGGASASRRSSVAQSQVSLKSIDRLSLIKMMSMKMKTDQASRLQSQATESEPEEKPPNPLIADVDWDELEDEVRSRTPETLSRTVCMPRAALCHVCSGSTHLTLPWRS